MQGPPQGEAEPVDVDGDEQLELVRMARLEAAFEGKFINQHFLRFFPDHNINSLKYKRSRHKYRADLASLVEAGPVGGGVRLLRRKSNFRGIFLI